MKIKIMSVFWVALLFCLIILAIQAEQVFTPEETAGLKQLRNLVGNSIEEDFMKSDSYLIRWVRTKNMDVPKATKALQETLKWRKENRISDILKEDMSQILNLAPYYTDGVSKTGQPVLEFYFGKWNVRKLTVAGKQGALLRHWDQMIEKSAQRVHQFAKNDQNITHYINLCDLNGYNLRQHGCLSCLPLVYDLVRHYEAYYPDYTDPFIIVNTPKIFENMLTFLKPIMSPALQNVMKTFGFDKKEFSAVILEKIEPNQLGKAFGGSKDR